MPALRTLSGQPRLDEPITSSNLAYERSIFPETENVNRKDFRYGLSQKRRQLNVVNQINPAPNEYLTRIRSENDIKTANEAFDERDWEAPDFTTQNVENIPNVVNSPDYLVYGIKTETGRNGIGYLKTITDGTTYYVEEVRDREKQLAAKTMYKIEGVAAESLVKDSVGHTSETAPSAVRLIDKLKKSTVVPAFTNDIAHGNTEVNKNDIRNNKLYQREDGYQIADDNETVDVVTIPENAIPDFKTKRELVTFIKNILGNERNITIKSTGDTVLVSNKGLQRAATKARSPEYNEVFGAVRQLLENAKYSGFVEADERHQNVRGQDVYHSGLVIGTKPYSVMFKVDIPKVDSSHNYAGHKISDIRIAPTDSNGERFTVPAKTDIDAIHEISLAVLRGKVNPARQKNNKLYQRAYAASRVDYDRPSLEAIGSGEKRIRDENDLAQQLQCILIHAPILEVFMNL